MKSKDNVFSQKQLEQIAQVVVTTVQPMINPISQRLDNIENRLDTLESRLDTLESFHKNDFDKLKSKGNKK